MSTPLWRKSSQSLTQEGSECVEVARLCDAIGIRDSKDRGGPKLVVSRSDLLSLLDRVKVGKHDLS